MQAHGLFRASHIAEESYRELRTYIQERGIFQKQKSDTLNRIQKVLTQMNIKYQHLISDIEGATGMKILMRIAQGIQDAESILEAINIKQLKASKEELIKSLTGVYKPHYVTASWLNLAARPKKTGVRWWGIRSASPIIRLLRPFGWPLKPCGSIKVLWGIYTDAYQPLKEAKKQSKQ